MSSSAPTPAPTATSGTQTNAASTRKRAAPELSRSGKKKKASEVSIWVDYGRIFGRAYNFLDPTGLILDLGLEIAIDRAAAEEACEDYEVEECDRRIEVAFLSLEKELSAKAPEALKDMDLAAKITGQIDNGITKAKSDDTRSLKLAVVDWLPEVPGEAKPHRTNKSGRGFNHSATGRLLIPVGAVWSTELQKKIQDGEMSFTGDEWPCLMYKDEKYNPEDPWDGFGKNEYAVKTFKHFFTSPSSAETENDGDSGTSRKGIAALHGYDSVTVGALCYVHSHLKFAVSSASTFSKTDSVKNGDLEAFYGSLYELLTDPEEKQNVDELLKWWNKRIFPSARRTRDRSAKSTREQFRRVREARAAAQEADESS